MAVLVKGGFLPVQHAMEAYGWRRDEAACILYAGTRSKDNRCAIQFSNRTRHKFALVKLCLSDAGCFKAGVDVGSSSRARGKPRVVCLKVITGRRDRCYGSHSRRSCTGGHLVYVLVPGVCRRYVNVAAYVFMNTGGR